MMHATCKPSHCSGMCGKSHQYLSNMANTRFVRTKRRRRNGSEQVKFASTSVAVFQPATQRRREIGLRSRLPVVRNAQRRRHPRTDPGCFPSFGRNARFGAWAGLECAPAVYAIGNSILSDTLPTMTDIRLANHGIRPATCTFSYRHDRGGRRNIHCHRRRGHPGLIVIATKACSYPPAKTPRPGLLKRRCGAIPIRGRN